MASGQNDPVCIPPFFSYNQNGGLAAEGKITYIIFTVGRTGTPDKDTNLARTFAKTIEEDDAGYHTQHHLLRSLTCHHPPHDKKWGEK